MRFESFALLLCTLVTLPLSSCNGGDASPGESESGVDVAGTSGAANSTANPGLPEPEDEPVSVEDLCVAPESGGTLGYGLEASCRPLKCGDPCDPCDGTNDDQCSASKSPHACNYYGQCVAVDPGTAPVDEPISRDDLCVAPKSGGTLGYGLDASCRPLMCGDTCDPCDGANGDECSASELPHACNYYGQCVAVAD